MKKKIASLTLAGLLFSCTTQLPGEAPESFSLIEPQDGLVIDEVTSSQTPILFSWEAPLNTDYYIVSLQSTDVTRQSFLDTVVETNSVKLDLPANIEMNWLVSAVNGVFKSNSLQTHRLQIGEIIEVDEVVEEPLDEEQQNIAPTIIKTNPPNGEIISGNSDAYLKWDFFDEDGPTDSSDLLQSLSFVIEIDTDESFSSPRVFDQEGKNDIWVTTNPNTTYYLRVHVSDGINQTEDESPFVFEIIPN